jgi:hypothetical protein
MRSAAVLILAVAGSWATAAAPAKLSKTLVVGDASVVVDWAPGWEVETNTAALPPSSAAFRPADATRMQALLTTGPMKDEISTDEGINKLVGDMATRLEEQSVEKKIEVQRIAGNAAHGYYVCAQDRAPKAGEYKYMCQGVMNVSGTPFVFTLLYNDSGKGDADKVIAAMKTLELAKRT